MANNITVKAMSPKKVAAYLKIKNEARRLAAADAKANPMQFIEVGHGLRIPAEYGTVENYINQVLKPRLTWYDSQPTIAAFKAAFPELW